MAEFTAEQVRAKTDRWRQIARDYRISQDRDGSVNAVPYEQLVAMLDAYAERLEQEEGPASLDPHAYARMCREEGRREILREIAALMAKRESGPFEYDEHCCVFNPAPSDFSRQCIPETNVAPAKHDPDCLWLRAQAAVKEQE